MKTLLRYAALLLAMLALSLPAPAAVPDVYVAPFELYNTPDLENLSQGLRTILASRLEGKGYAVRTQGDAPQGPLDWVVRTSITRLGKVYSIDVSLDAVQKLTEGGRSYGIADGVDALMPALEEVAEHIRTDLGNKISRSAPPAAAATPATATTPDTPAAAVPTTVVATVPAPAAPADLTGALENQRTGPKIEGAATSIVLTDADNDGNAEILVLLPDSIVAFRDQNGELRKVWDSPTPQTFTATTLSAGDIDGDGTPELFIAGIRLDSPVTQVMEWVGSALAPKGARVQGFLRAVSHPEKGVLLLGYAPGIRKDLFAEDMREYRWNGSTYEASGKFPAPSQAIGVNLNFIGLGDPAEVYTVVTSQADHLIGINTQGEHVFELDDVVKGTVVRLFGEEQSRDNQDGDIVQISGNTLGYRSPDGVDHVVLYKNSGGIGRLFHNIVSFSNGRILTYSWNGMGMSASGKSPKYGGYIADISMAPRENGTGPRLYAALVRVKGTLSKKRTTQLVAYTLP